MNNEIIIGALIFALIALLVSYSKLSRRFKEEAEGLIEYRFKYSKLSCRFKGVLDAESEAEIAKARLEEIEKNIREKKNIHKNLELNLASMQMDFDALDCGHYEPHFNYDTPQQYKDKIKEVRGEQRMLISSKEAIRVDVELMVDDSRFKGRKMTRAIGRMMLRAFNSECDGLISKVNWNNIMQIENHIKKVFEAINKIGASSSLGISESYSLGISESYLSLKVDELRLVFEYAQKKNDDREIQRLLKEQMREEERALREAEKAKRQAREEEFRYEKALNQAKEELESASQADRLRLEESIADLKLKLQQAEEKKQRAISMAQRTKSGHVYVISNIGSFGEDMFKIGMTRRLVPEDRVKELGDASVPFPFDVHAIIHAENAPGLEKHLHRHLESRRVNKANSRKEFFRVSLDEIEKLVIAEHGEIEFIKIAEAQEYRETLSIEGGLE